MLVHWEYWYRTISCLHRIYLSAICFVWEATLATLQGYFGGWRWFLEMLEIVCILTVGHNHLLIAFCMAGVNMDISKFGDMLWIMHLAMVNDVIIRHGIMHAVIGNMGCWSNAQVIYWTCVSWLIRRWRCKGPTCTV